MAQESIPAVWTYEEAVKRCYCGLRSLKAAVSRGEIEAYRPGKKVLLVQSSVIAWFHSKKTELQKRTGRPRAGARR